jgi:hypothetical protein
MFFYFEKYLAEKMGNFDALLCFLHMTWNGFKKNWLFFRRKLAKIAENSCNKIGPFM